MLCFRTFEWRHIFRINFVLDGANAKLGDEEMNGPRSLKWLIFGLYARVAWRGRGIYFNGPLLFDRNALFSTKSLNLNLQILLILYSYLGVLKIYRVQIKFCQISSRQSERHVIRSGF
jgi:hypothetical protein